MWWSWHLWLGLSTAVPTVKISDYCFNKQFLSEVPDICCCKRKSAKGTKDGEVLKKHNPWGSPFNLPQISLFLKKNLKVISHTQRYTKRDFSVGCLLVEILQLAESAQIPKFHITIVKTAEGLQKLILTHLKYHNTSKERHHHDASS